MSQINEKSQPENAAFKPAKRSNQPGRAKSINPEKSETKNERMRGSNPSLANPLTPEVPQTLAANQKTGTTRPNIHLKPLYNPKLPTNFPPERIRILGLSIYNPFKAHQRPVEAF